MDPDEREAEGRVFTLLGNRLDQLISRAIPVRGVHAGPVDHTTRLRFADGTTLLVRGQHSGDMARVLQAVQAGKAVLVEGWDRSPEGLAMSLAVQSGNRRLHLAIFVLGRDQPD